MDSTSTVNVENESLLHIEDLPKSSGATQQSMGSTSGGGAMSSGLVTRMDVSGPVATRSKAAQANCNERVLDLVFTGVLGAVMRDDGPFVAEDSHHPALNINLSLCAHTSIQSHTSGDHRAYNFRRANFPALYI
ncbi:hypothetical protein QE152_g9436 [Popillia japonica]|uniref:Uncharacterized protein n=1 Tax=Popillia japonica TaxID=7064 RepID=A0AAW1LY81_POPJA